MQASVILILQHTISQKKKGKKERKRSSECNLQASAEAVNRIEFSGSQSAPFS